MSPEWHSLQARSKMGRILDSKKTKRSSAVARGLAADRITMIEKQTRKMPAANRCRAFGSVCVIDKENGKDRIATKAPAQINSNNQGGIDREEGIINASSV
jgi:hypothetical protein